MLNTDFIWIFKTSSGFLASEPSTWDNSEEQLPKTAAEACCPLWRNPLQTFPYLTISANTSSNQDKEHMLKYLITKHKYS